MPKAKKYKAREKTKTDPLSRSEEHVKAHEKVLPVIESLRSARETDRKWSSAIIGELVQDDTLRLTLLREGKYAGRVSTDSRDCQWTVGSTDGQFIGGPN